MSDRDCDTAPLSVDEAAELVNQIEQVATIDNDIEKAHSLEDALYARFVSDVADHKYQSVIVISTIARVLIKTKKLDFERW